MAKDMKDMMSYGIPFDIFKYHLRVSSLRSKKSECVTPTKVLKYVPAFGSISALHIWYNHAVTKKHGKASKKSREIERKPERKELLFSTRKKVCPFKNKERKVEKGRRHKFPSTFYLSPLSLDFAHVLAKRENTIVSVRVFLVSHKTLYKITT